MNINIIEANKEENIVDMICELKNNSKLIDFGTKEIQITITNLLHSLGMPSHVKGYKFIRMAIAMVYNDPCLIGRITKVLYPGLSIKFNTTMQSVERAIRHAIEISWIRGDIELMEDIFGHSIDINKSKPTNREFIVTIADKLRLDMIKGK